jgi:hypothetical protein
MANNSNINIKEIFDNIDVDGNGILSKNEFD